MKKIKLVFFIFLFFLINPVFLFASDWSAFRKDAQRSGSNYKETFQFPITLQWSTDQLDKTCHYSSPSVSGDTVYIGLGEGRLYTFNRKTGIKGWEYNTKGSIYSTPAVGDGIICFGCSDGNFYVLDAADGSPKWIYNIGNSINSSPAISGNFAYFGANNGYLYSLDI